MPRNNYGGAREGAGRPPGRKNDTTLTRETAWSEVMKRLSDASPDVTPLGMALALMREALVIGDLDRALTFGFAAMPYCHAKKAPVAERDPNAPTIAEISNDPDPEMAD